MKNWKTDKFSNFPKVFQIISNILRLQPSPAPPPPQEYQIIGKLENTKENWKNENKWETNWKTRGKI